MDEPRSGKNIVFLLIALLAIVLCFVFYKIGEGKSGGGIRVVYSLDKMQNDQEIINVINNAHSYVYFAIYEFTKSNIADALIDAKKRGVDVEGITDRENAKDDYESPIVAKLEAAGIPLETQKHQDGIMHIKAIVTESQYASGSYNWTSSATEDNDEILEIGSVPAVRSQYESILKKILSVNSGSAPQKGSSTSAPEASATNDGKVYDYADAQNHIGQNTGIRGTIVDVYKTSKGITYFDYCKSYKTCPFSVVIFSDDASKFSNLASYMGKEIVVTGQVKNYDGKAEMILNSPDQIESSE